MHPAAKKFDWVEPAEAKIYNTLSVYISVQALQALNYNVTSIMFCIMLYTF